MSYKKMDRVLPILSQQKTAQIIGEILREIYDGNGSSVKAIAAVIPADLRTIKSWYEGQNVPNLSHFLELCANAPEFLSAILKAIGYIDLAVHLEQRQRQEGENKNAEKIEVISIIFDTNDSASTLDLIRQLSIRQLWFYGELKKGNSPSLIDLIRFWDVGEATAKRDLSDLARLGLVRFVGAKRSGYYEIQ
jgi:hypothetical protein